MQFVDPSDDPVGVARTYGRVELDEAIGADVAHGYYQERSATGIRDTLYDVRGVSVLRLIAARGAVASHVTLVEILQTGRDPIVLRSDLGDLSVPGAVGFPYANAMPPLFSPDCCTGDIYAVVNYREQPTGTGGSTDNGGYLTASNGSNLTATVHLDGALLFPVVQNPPTTVAAGTPVDVAAGLTDGSDPGRYGWSWDFGDGGTGAGSSTTHTFTTPGTYSVQAAAEGTGSDRSSGLSAPVTVQVTAAQSSPPVSSPPPSPPPSVQPSLGNGGPAAPNGGPVSGTGSRVGGVASGSGSGRPGPSADSRSSATAASGALPTGTAGALVGQLLSGVDAPVAQRSQVAARPLDDTAPAARSGVGPSRLGWLAGGFAVVVLLVLGAGTERRRPARPRSVHVRPVHLRPRRPRRPHRPPTRRAR